MFKLIKKNLMMNLKIILLLSYQKYLFNVKNKEERYNFFGFKYKFIGYWLITRNNIIIIVFIGQNMLKELLYTR